MDFMKDLEKNEKAITDNGAIGYKTSGSYLLDLNFSVPKFRNAIDTKLFDKALAEDKLLTLKWLLYLRDIKCGLGERKSFRDFLVYLCNKYEDLGSSFIDCVDIEEYGRWDDYIYLYFNTTNIRVKEIISTYLFYTFKDDLFDCAKGRQVSLLAKWLPSENASSMKTRAMAKYLRKHVFKLSAKEYRKSLSALRKQCASVEVLTSSNKWNEIDYSAVPSKANIKYASAFLRHDYERRIDYLDDLSEGKTKINCDSMFLYDIVHKYKFATEEEEATLDALWENQKPIELTGDVLVVRDGSGSMLSFVSGSVSASDICDSICLYCAEHNSGAFKNKFITFSSKPRVVDLTNFKTLGDKLGELSSYDDWTNTDLDRTFKLILDTAVKNGYKQEDMPKTILIVSDMMFDSGCNNIPLMEEIANNFAMYGYKLPKLVFWNVSAGNMVVPIQQNDNGVILVSGFSKNLVEMVVSSDIDPYKALVNVLNSDRYNIDGLDLT